MSIDDLISVFIMISERNIEQKYKIFESLEGYHMFIEDIILLKIINESEIQVQSLFWDNKTINYSDVFNLVKTENMLNSDNVFNINIFDNSNYSIELKFNGKHLYSITGVGYEYLGGDITENIIFALSGYQNEYTGIYRYSMMEPQNKIEEIYFAFINNQLSDGRVVNVLDSYIEIKLLGNGSFLLDMSASMPDNLRYGTNIFF